MLLVSSWFFTGLLLLSAAFMLGAMLVGLRRRWEPASRLSRNALLVAIVAMVLPGAVLVAIARSFDSGRTLPDAWIGFPADDAAHRANYLADAISDLINCVALGVPVAIFAFAVWLVTRSNARLHTRAH